MIHKQNLPPDAQARMKMLEQHLDTDNKTGYSNENNNASQDQASNNQSKSGNSSKH